MDMHWGMRILRFQKIRGAAFSAFQRLTTSSSSVKSSQFCSPCDVEFFRPSWVLDSTKIFYKGNAPVLDASAFIPVS